MPTDLVEAPDLLSQLDPMRSYGDRPFAAVVKAVNEGKLLLSEGQKLPVIVDAVTGRLVAGTGIRPMVGDPQRWSKTEFVRRAVDDMDEAYSELREAMKKLDMKAHKLFWDALIGPGREQRGSEMNSALAKLIEKAAESIPAVVAETFIEGEARDL